MNSNMIAPHTSTGLTHTAQNGSDDVVEIGLLLPAKRADALLRLARDRRESVGQVLRKLIEMELAKPA